MSTSAPAETAAAIALQDAVFGKNNTGIFALLDGASSPKLVKSLYQLKPEFCCLYPGELPPDMAAVAPYLVKLEPDKDFTNLLLQEGWGAHWGMFVVSSADLRALRDHFREFHKVELPDQRTVIFRYYDPRVLGIFLPVCNAMELAQFFGPVQSFVLEGEAPESGVRFVFAAQALKSETFKIKKNA